MQRIRMAAASLRHARFAHVLFEVVVSATILGSPFVPPQYGGMVDFSPLSISFVLAACVATQLRRWAPRASMALTTVFAGASILVGGAISAQLVALLVTLFTVGQLTNRRTTLVASAAALTVIWLAVVIQFGFASVNLRAASQTVASVGFVAAIGDASRSRRAYIAGITERARYAEESKEAEARRRVAEERVAIARDLHDLVAHQIAVVSLNVGVVRRALRDRPDDAARALDVIHAASQTVLEEISGLMTVLRAPDDIHPDSRIAPTPGLGGLTELTDEFRGSGLAVNLHIEGVPRPIPEAVDLVAYRALQEALTNAFKHGRGESSERATVNLEYRQAAIVVTVTNRVADASSAGAAPISGHGLNGVRERVASVRGFVEAGPGPDGVFRFSVILPTGDGGVGKDRTSDISAAARFGVVRSAPTSGASS